VAALLVAAPALGARVHIRVEGASQTIYGSTDPFVTPVTGTIAPPAGTSVTVSAETPLGALERASRLGEFFYRIETFSFGPYVSQIGRYAAAATTGWVYKVNGKSPPVGASAYTLRAGDRVLWYFARFGASGGPKTLRLKRVVSRLDCIREPCPGQGVHVCYQAQAQDDNGRATPVTGVVFRLNGRRVRSADGEICPNAGWRTLRVTKTGYVRSSVLTRR
jgi:hypothetical protein